MDLWSRLWCALRATIHPENSAVGRPERRYQPLLERLEDRLVPASLSSISGNFNGTAIPANDTLWFSSVAQVHGLGSAPATIELSNQSISFVATAPRSSTACPMPSSR